MGLFCQGVRQSGKSFVLRQFLCSISKPVSSSRPAGSLTSSRAGAVKVGRRANLAACSELARPYLDSFEHDGTLGAIGMTISAGYGQAVTLRRGCFAHVSGRAGSRATVRTMRTRILKSKAPDCSGAFAFEGTIHPRKNVNTCRRVSDQHRSQCRDQRCLDPMDSPRRLRWHRCACSTL
jgi:hypothetical protein